MSRIQLLQKVLTTCAAVVIPQIAVAQVTNQDKTHDPPESAAQAPSAPAGSVSGNVEQRRSAPNYLAQAKSQLDAVPASALNHDASKLLSDLRRAFDELQTAYGAQALPAHAGPRETTDGNVSSAADWQTRFSEVERRLTEIVGGGSSYSPSYQGASGANPLNATSTQNKAAATSASATLVAPVTSPGTTVTVPPATTPPASSPPPSPVTPTAPGVTPPAQASSSSTPSPAVASPPGPATSAGAAAAGSVAPPPETAVTAAGAGPVNSNGASTSAGTTTLVAGPNGTAGSTTPTGAVALAGVLVSTIGIKNLDPAVRAQLEQFRTSVELFYDATNRLGGY